MIELLTADKAIEYWPEIEEEVAKYLLPDNDIRDIRYAVRDSRAQIVVARNSNNEIQGHLTFSVNNETAFVICVAGRDIANNESIDKFISILQDIGVKRIRGVCRPEAARLWSRFKMEPKYQIMERTIWAE